MVDKLTKFRDEVTKVAWEMSDGDAFQFKKINLEQMVNSLAILELIEEVKGLREDLKVKVETVKASAEPIKPVAEEKPKAPAKK